MIEEKSLENGGIVREQRIVISKRELRSLLHWATYGVRKARGGSYAKTICGTIKNLEKQIGLQGQGLFKMGDLLAAPSLRTQRKEKA